MDDLKKLLSIFQLQPNFTFEELKVSYKKLILKHHPDKTQDIKATVSFQRITEAFRTLHHLYELRQAEKTHFDLSQQYKTNQSSPPPAPAPTPTPPPPVPPPSSKNFNVKVFNELYDSNRLETPYDTGYEDWKKQEVNPKEIHNNSIVKYQEPQALVSSKSLKFQELGVSRIKDFSSVTPPSNHSLNYMDFRVAHTTDKLLDDQIVKQRKEYKSVQDLEQERSKVAFTMNDEELRAYVKKNKREELMEQQRIQNMMKQDKQIEAHHQKVTNLLGYFTKQ
jgi:curved DNA-binding protein CbpA